MLRFPKSARLTQSAEFKKVKHEGKAYHGKFMVLNVLKNSEPQPARTGFITSRRVGGAVQRNRVRRRLRELVRASRPDLKNGCWLVLIARASAVRASWQELHDEWIALARQSAILSA